MAETSKDTPGTLTREARAELWLYVVRLLDEWDTDGEVQWVIRWPVSDRPRAVVKVRDRLIKALRDTVWQDGKRGAVNFIVSEDRPLLYAYDWRPLSTTNIGSLLHLTHGAVVRALARERKREDEIAAGRAVAKAAFEVSPAKAGVELPEVTVRRMRGHDA